MVIITIIKRYRNYLATKNAIKQAKRMHKLTNRKYYVLRVFGKLHVFDRAKINHLVNEKILHQSLRYAINIEKHAIYYTGQPDNCKPKHSRNTALKPLKPFKSTLKANQGSKAANKIRRRK